jgi:hypothetical protein
MPEPSDFDRLIGRLQRAVRELFADVQVASDEADWREAQKATEQAARDLSEHRIAWVYAVVDRESAEHVYVAGPFPTPEAALLASEKRKKEDRRLNMDEPLWEHFVLPLYQP